MRGTPDEGVTHLPRDLGEGCADLNIWRCWVEIRRHDEEADQNAQSEQLDPAPYADAEYAQKYWTLRGFLFFEALLLFGFFVGGGDGWSGTLRRRHIIALRWGDVTHLTCQTWGMDCQAMMARYLRRYAVCRDTEFRPDAGRGLKCWRRRRLA